MPHDDARSLATRRSTVVVASLATVGMTLWMANRDPFPRGVLWGTCIALLAAGAWTRWLVVPRGGTAKVVRWQDTPFGRQPGERWSPLHAAALALAVWSIGLAVGGYDALPLTICLTLACGVPAALRRPGLGVILLVSALYLPLLGGYTLMDPWETHYGEVSREVLARNDWISLWWAQDKWFWSKPALLFWAEAWTMGAMGVDFLPNANPAHPEWAIRLPTFVSALVALGAVYLMGRRAFGTRAGVVAALVVATMPQFFFISHQAITDLPLVAAITVAACCLWAAIQEDPSAEATVYRLGRVELSAQHLVVFLLILAVLPQATYLIARNVSWLDGWHIVAHPDRFLYGSGGNLDVPGNPTPHDQLPRIQGLIAQPFLQGLLWIAGLAGLGALLRRERRRRALWMFAFYFACALGLLAKGLVAVAVPGLIALLYLAATRRWRLLSEGQLHIGAGILTVITVSIPWYLAMYVRHGAAFTNRLLIHDHINRLAAGVHGDKGTISYFLTQLGYATFPWIAWIPIAGMLAFWLSGRDRSGEKRDAVVFLGVWMAATFVLFSAMVTKFHHYLLPTIVPAGMLVGVSVASLWGPKHTRATVAMLLSAGFVVLGFAYLAGDPRGVVPAGSTGVEDWVRLQASPAKAAGCLSMALALALAARHWLSNAETRVIGESRHVAIGVMAAFGVALVAFVGRDLSWITQARPQGDERLLHLFIYNYTRLWPEHLDYRPILIGFSVAAALMTAGVAWRSWRAPAVRGLMCVAILCCAWGLDVYMVDIANHWGFKNLAERYYEDRGDGDAPLLAWQMNWKGENFYTGNRVYAFAELDNKRLKKWLAKNEGRRAYVVLEHKRLKKFEALVGDRSIEPLTGVRDCNKFLLVRLEI
ncbi:MAG: glycosyltransferase family 39 protein [Polyangiales bacterium]